MRLSTTLIAATATVVVNVCHGQNEGNSHYKINDNNNNMKPWLPGDYPQAHHEQCWRRISSSQATTATQQEPSLRSCDPDEVFSDKDWAEIDRALWNTPPKLHVLCGTNHEMHEFSVQIAVAVTRKVSIPRVFFKDTCRLFSTIVWSLVFLGLSSFMIYETTLNNFFVVIILLSFWIF